jgi:hypothetical protein
VANDATSEALEKVCAASLDTAFAWTGASAGLVVRWTPSDDEGKAVYVQGTGEESARRIAAAFVRMEARGLSGSRPDETWVLQALAQSLWPSADRGLVAAPLIVAEELWGFLLLMWESATEIRAEDRSEQVSLLARQLSVSIDFATSCGDLEQRVETLGARIAQSFFRQAHVQGAAAATLKRLESHEGFGDLTSVAQILFGATYAALLAREDGGELAVVAAVGRPTEGEEWLAHNGHIVRLAGQDRTMILLPGPSSGGAPEAVRMALPINDEDSDRETILVLEAPCDERLAHSEAGWTLLEHLGEVRREAAEICRKVQSLHLDAVMALAEATDAIEPYKRGTSETVRRTAAALAEAMELPTERVEALQCACLLRDIGMISISRDVLHRPGELTEDEWEKIHQHPVTGAALLERIPYLREVAPLIRAHQERYDGTGYPDGLSGDAIPLEARILAVAEAFCAMTSERPHRAAMSSEQALAEINGESGQQFDPQIVDRLAAIVR